MLDLLETPALIIDLQRLKQNCDRARARCLALGTVLRPHVKTTKSVEIARLAVDPEFGGIAVSTLTEAEYFAAAGFTNIQYAVCVEPSKVGRVIELARLVERFSVFVDSIEAVEALSVSCPLGRSVGIWIEVDSGEHRTGVPSEGPRLVEIAGAIAAAPGLYLEGVATHAGQAYDAADVNEIIEIAAAERAAIVAARNLLQAKGHQQLRTSVGSTPTLMHAGSGEGIDEFRAGVYVLGDLFQAGIGSMAKGDIALTVLTSVLSRNEAKGRFFVDAGGLALSKDRSTIALPGHDAGYGELLSLNGQPFHGLHINEVAQEHGFVDVPPGIPLPPLGTRLRVLPNHACMTAAMYQYYHVVNENQLVAKWSRVNGWSR